MNLQDRVHVAQRFQRAIRIDADLNDPKALEGFICPKSSADVLLTMAHHVASGGQAAFTWTGPYGTGKSSLAVALSSVLNGNAKRRLEATASLGKRVTDSLWAALPPKQKGWRILPVIGQRAAPAPVIGDALVRSGYLGRQVPRKWTDENVVDALKRVAAFDPKSHGGLLIFLDEMGKFLEGAAQDGHDTFLFQQLAEAAARSNGRLIVVGILHQSFEEYAHRVARDVRDEWAKVQGRFVDLIINTGGDEQLDLLARAIRTDDRPQSAARQSNAVADVIRAGRPGVSKTLPGTLEKCWPLHPIVAALLGPISRRRFGQNQRSLFGFLNSAEPFGFQEFLRDATENDTFDPARLWDYLRVNLEPAILASPDGHKWSMAVESIERCEVLGASPLHLSQLKTIALLDLFRERSGLSATPDLLATCALHRMASAKVVEAVRDLQAWSLIVLRKHLGAYAIHAGSDFDVEHAMTAALDSIQNVDLRQLRTLAGLQPVLAKRHYHQTGALRWFDVDLVPLSEVGTYRIVEDTPTSLIGSYLLAIPTANETESYATKVCAEAASRSVGETIIGLSPAAWQVTRLAREFLAITKINEERPELAGDPVARREVLARLTDIRAHLETSLQEMFNTAEWHRRGSKPTRYSYAELNVLASSIADSRFPSAPRLMNELLNREEPSSNAIAAKKALLKLMVTRGGEARLGIEGFPAEAGLFESLLLQTGLYRCTAGRWHFASPSATHDSAGLLPAWKAAATFLETNADRPVAVSELYALWQAPPFGIKAGLLPVIVVALILSRRDMVALYRDGVFQGRFTDLDIDHLTMDPTSIQLRWMRLSGTSRSILSGLAEVVVDLDDQNQLVHLQPIDVARGLVAIHMGLNPWVKKTARLSANALRIRSLFKNASDPNKFLFDDIPALVGSAGTKSDRPRTDHIIEHVREGLQELTQAYGGMLDRLYKMMLTELRVPNSSPQALAELRSRATNIRELTGDFRLNAFIGRLSAFSGSQEDIEGLASLATNKPARDWVDADLDRGAVELADLAQQFVRAETFARVKGRRDKRQAMAIIIGLDGRPTPVSGDFTISDADRPSVVRVTAALKHTLLSSAAQDRNVALAALAEVSVGYLDLPDASAQSPRRGTRRTSR